MRKSCFIYVTVFSFLLIGCSENNPATENGDVVVAIQAESVAGSWQREFDGPASKAEAFADEALNIADVITNRFSGEIEMKVLIDGQ